MSCPSAIILFFLSATEEKPTELDGSFVIIVPTNRIRRHLWMKNGEGPRPAHRFGDFLDFPFLFEKITKESSWNGNNSGCVHRLMRSRSHQASGLSQRSMLLPDRYIESPFSAAAFAMDSREIREQPTRQPLWHRSKCRSRDRTHRGVGEDAPRRFPSRACTKSTSRSHPR